MKGGLTLLDKVACIFGVRLLPCFATLTGNELVAHLNPEGVPDFSGAETRCEDPKGSKASGMSEQIDEEQRWVCPNDRQLCLRAK